MGHAKKLQKIDYKKNGLRGCLMEPIILILNLNDNNYSNIDEEDF